MCIESIVTFGLRRSVVVRVTLRIEVSVVQRKSAEENLKAVQQILGVLLTKTGPIRLTVRDLELYEMAHVYPYSDIDAEGISLYLLGEDEINDANFSGRG
jgi:hypothetical protein